MLAAGILIAGTALSMYSQYKQNKLDQASLMDEANNLEQQSEELKKRFSINMQQTKEKGVQVRGEQLSKYAGSGVAITTGAPLVAATDTVSAVVDQITNLRREMNFERSQLFKEAEAKRTRASETAKAGKLGMLGGLLEGGASLFGK